MATITLKTAIVRECSATGAILNGGFKAFVFPLNFTAYCTYRLQTQELMAWAPDGGMRQGEGQASTLYRKLINEFF